MRRWRLLGSSAMLSYRYRHGTALAAACMAYPRCFAPWWHQRLFLARQRRKNAQRQLQAELAAKSREKRRKRYAALDNAAGSSLRAVRV
mgnify:CR=1 FL=1